MKILCFGDLFAEVGTSFFLKHLPDIQKKYNPDFVVVNAENSGPGGRGPMPSSLDRLLLSDIDVLTGGNHSFDRRESYPYYTKYSQILRPCNFPAGAPGKGYGIFETKNGGKVGVINVQLRTFMRAQLECPFRKTESILQIIKPETKNIIIDVHGEATAEKLTFASYFDGDASVIFGTHTHVPTADERIMPKGTGYITDIGTTGAAHSSLGLKFSGTLQNFLTQLPVRFEVETEGPFWLCGLYIETDDLSGKALKIERIMIKD